MSREEEIRARLEAASSGRDPATMTAIAYQLTPDLVRSDLRYLLDRVAELERELEAEQERPQLLARPPSAGGSMTAAEALRALRALPPDAPRRRIAWDYLTGLDLGALDVESPLVVGCLLALLREASGDPGLYVRPSNEGWAAVGDDEYPQAATEGGAIVAALIALAEAL